MKHGGLFIRGAAAAATFAATVFGFSGAVSAQQAPDCYEHETWYKGSHGAPADDLSGVILATFDSAWEQDHWESITVTGPGGSVTTDHPAPGFYPAPGGELLGWSVCKGYDHPTPTTTPSSVVPPTTSVVGASTTAPPTPVPSTTLVPFSLQCPLPIFTGNVWVCPAPPPTIPLQIDLDVTACDQVPADCAPRTTLGLTITGDLPATGRNTDLLLLVGTLTAAAGVALLLVRRRPRVA